MTRHVNQDTALKLALGILAPPAERRVRNHLQECRACTSMLEKVQTSIRVIENVTPHVSVRTPPLASRRAARYSWLRVAAMLALGFGVGFLASESLHSPAVTVVGQQIVPRPPESSADGCVVCDEIDLSVRLR